ncbi:hypothetical protein EDD18DRAFT_1355808 [Armillaria luteobubalina]|uniref:Uncharacterized protein n=1 Tax=Armillaria luteobubalina TaxID=153913 RepID=A0AA39TLF2_9AGAR|nr:hypothetical protein EDD18DRAFT_1355808 [Armillaria luteobubalina]
MICAARWLLRCDCVSRLQFSMNQLLSLVSQGVVAREHEGCIWAHGEARAKLFPCAAINNRFQLHHFGGYKLLGERTSHSTIIALRRRIAVRRAGACGTQTLPIAMNFAARRCIAIRRALSTVILSTRNGLEMTYCRLPSRIAYHTENSPEMTIFPQVLLAKATDFCSKTMYGHPASEDQQRIIFPPEDRDCAFLSRDDISTSGKLIHALIPILPMLKPCGAAVKVWIIF